eukprot:CAMPEP_0116133766 /NCGR_PEP_ID=MMETSP0329-20121206/10283_1 /TAXON_ID=697910 /ORGANISM="Pseudo-nitzschia arenysensis, Strain B593" /LENGTH=392 /DNA_ID=CAMNT_0003628423 /DNA_START=122 /DNA_END=1300 /DNA_ORIENTATION=-
MVDAGERLQVLLTQEATNYQTCDYLSRMQGLAKAQESVLEAASDVGQQSQVDPSSSPKKRKSWGDLSSADGSDSQNTESCRRTASTTCASSAGAASVASSSSGTSQINKHWREKICEWAYQVVDHFDLNREVVSTAMSHLDRFLGVYNGTVDKNLFQLLAMTCLYLSVKLNEYKHLLIPGSKSSMDTILQLSRGFFTLKEMEKMEYEVLQRLRWHVHPPTAQLFVKHFLFFLSVEEHELHDLAQFMIELSVMDYFFVSYKPSEIAMAALLNSMDRLGIKSASRTNFPITRFVDIHSPAILACRERLSLIYAQANEQGGMEDSEDSPVRPDATAEPAEPTRLQRTISPVSVMAPPDTNDDTNQFGCQQQQQQYINSASGDSMDTDDYFVGYYD